MSQWIGLIGIAGVLAMFLWTVFRPARPSDNPHDSGPGGAL